jgi:SAM-dependent methyltransferase
MTGRSDSASAARTFYDSRYHFAEDVDRPNAERLWRALRHLEPLPGATLLDLGCGVGWSTRIAITRGGVSHAVGLDFSRTALALATRQTGIDEQKRVEWVCGDGTALPFGDGSFDRAFSFGSMEHFPDVRRGFAELARVLKPGGRAVSVVPNFYVRTGQPVEHHDTLAGWRRIIEGAGLEVTRVAGDHGPALLKNRRPARIALRLALRAASVIPALRYQFIFVMRKL